MAKGKYAARAANREAARDNELIVEKMAEIEDLRRQLADVKDSLEAERRDRGTLAITRANELSAEQIALVRKEARVNEDRHREQMAEFADWLVELFNHLTKEHPDMKILPLDYPEKFALLVGNENMGEYVSKFVFAKHGTDNRRRRRLRPDDVRRLNEHHLQDMGFNGENPLLVKAGVGVKEAAEQLFTMRDAQGSM